jgi:hypothetical protein
MSNRYAEGNSFGGFITLFDASQERTALESGADGCNPTNGAESSGAMNP